MGVDGVNAMDPAAYHEAAIAAIQQLADDVGIPRTLSDLGVK